MNRSLSEAQLIYNWNLKGRRSSLAPGLRFLDETLRDGIQGPSICLLYTSPSPRDLVISRMPSSA